VGKTVKKILKVALAIGVIVGTFGGVGLALAAGLPGFAAGIAIVQALAVSTLIKAFTPGFGSIKASRQLAQNLSIFSNPMATRGVAFGRAGIAGQILFRENIENSGETPDELLIILGLAGYPATALETFTLNGEQVFSGNSTTGPGAITTGTFANDLWVWFRTGDETTPAFPDIAALSTTWNARTRILRGIPSIAIRLRITDRVQGKFEPLAQIQGARLYDPRLDSTVPGGSGAHRFATPSTWAWSENPKLAELLYLRGADVNGTRIFGMGKPAAAIDLENFAAEANICEEQIAVVGGGTIDRYTFNGVLVPNSNHKSNLQEMLTASAGTMDASGGIYRTFAGAWRASSMTFDESDIDGAPTEVQLQIDQADEVNIISGSFADPNDNWVIKEYPELIDSASIASFGENAKKLDLAFTTDHRIAQRIAKIQMRRANAKRAFSANYWLRAVSLQPGDIVTQTYSRYRINAETFRINLWALEAREDRQSNQRLVVPMQLTEELQSWFDWDETTEEQSTSTITALPTINRLPRLITLGDSLVFVGATAPADPQIGWLWRDTGVNIVFRWDGVAWIEFSKIGAGGSSAMNVGRRMNDFSEWFSDSGQSAALPTSVWSVQFVTAPVWPTVFRGVENVASTRNMFSERMTLDVTKKHRVSIWAQQPSGDRNNYLLVAFYDSNGDLINNTSTPVSDATGWGGIGTYHYWSIVNANFAVAFTNYTFDFGGDAVATIPTGAVTMAIGGLFLRPGTNQTTVEIQDLFVVELADDGATGSPGSPGSPGADGADAITGYLTNDSEPVPHDADGTNGVFTNANGEFRVNEGSTSRTAVSMFSIVSTTNVTAEINTTVNEFFVGPIGAYRITAMTADTGQATFRAVFGGVTIDNIFSVSKQLSALPVVLLSFGGNINSTGAGNQTAGIRFNPDGTIESFTTAGGWVSFGTWIDKDADATYRVREVAASGDAWNTEAEVAGTWIDLGAVRTWDLLDTDISAINFQTRAPTFEISKDGGAAITGDSLGITANRNA